jgi:hypothetical protein
MVNNPVELLARHQRQRDLVSVRRDDIDDNSIQGYVLAVSDRLVALQHVYDFRLEGLMILRTEDLTDVEYAATSQFQNELLVREGLTQAVPFDKRFDLENWPAAIRQLAREFPLLIVECEALHEPAFAIGRVHGVSEEAVDLEYFDGVGQWEKDLVEIEVEDISSCQVDTNYLNVYRRHFERMALS